MADRVVTEFMERCYSATLNHKMETKNGTTYPRGRLYITDDKKQRWTLREARELFDNQMSGDDTLFTEVSQLLSGQDMPQHLPDDLDAILECVELQMSSDYRSKLIQLRDWLKNPSAAPIIAPTPPAPPKDTCANCGKELTFPKMMMPRYPGLFCSHECIDAKMPKKQYGNCRHCGKPVDASHSTLLEHIYCNDECLHEHMKPQVTAQE